MKCHIIIVIISSNVSHSSTYSLRPIVLVHVATCVFALRSFLDPSGCRKLSLLSLVRMAATPAERNGIIVFICEMSQIAEWLVWVFPGEVVVVGDGEQTKVDTYE